jgi:hypothetical protein
VAGSDAVTDCLALPGYTGDVGSGITICAAGKFKADDAQTLCDDCTAGKTTSSTGSKSSDDCTGGSASASVSVSESASGSDSESASGSDSAAELEFPWLIVGLIADGLIVVCIMGLIFNRHQNMQNNFHTSQVTPAGVLSNGVHHAGSSAPAPLPEETCNSNAEDDIILIEEFTAGSSSSDYTTSSDSDSESD